MGDWYHGVGCNCPSCCRERSAYFQNREDFGMSIDKPHKPFGSHVDDIQPLYGIPGAVKTRIGTDGSILSTDINIKKNWP